MLQPVEQKKREKSGNGDKIKTDFKGEIPRRDSVLENRIFPGDFWSEKGTIQEAQKGGECGIIEQSGKAVKSVGLLNASVR